MNKTVYLSPSVQEKNTGHGGYGTEEKRMNQVADVIEKELKRHGVNVLRNKPEWSLAQIIVESNKQRVDLHLAVHSNAGGGRGCEVFCYLPGGDSERAAQEIYKELEAITPSKDRGVKFNKNLLELNATKAPAVLAEVAFHDHPEDAVWIVENIEAIGIAITKGALKFMGVAYGSRAELDEITDRINQNLEIIDAALASIRRTLT